MLDGAGQDVRFALRALRGSPDSRRSRILSLALGIGANTAIFSLSDAVMLRSLPVSHPEQLLQVTMGSQMVVFLRNFRLWPLGLQPGVFRDAGAARGAGSLADGGRRHPFPIMGVAERGFTGVEVGASADIFAPLCAEKIVQGEISLLDCNFIPGWLKIVGDRIVTASKAAAA